MAGNPKPRGKAAEPRPEPGAGKRVPKSTNPGAGDLLIWATVCETLMCEASAAGTDKDANDPYEGTESATQAEQEK